MSPRLRVGIPTFYGENDAFTAKPYYPSNATLRNSLGRPTMPSKYQRLIGDYCAKHGVAVPPPFGRNTPAVTPSFGQHLTPPKLIAQTWFKTADVLYYIEHFLQPELGDALAKSIRILDFQEGEELAYTGGKRLDRVATFSITHEIETA